MSLEDRVERLGQQTLRTRAELEADREKKKKLAERDKLIDEAPEWIVTDFWCDWCDKDFTCRAYKIVQSDTIAGQRLAFYQAWKGDPRYCHKSRRRITDKHFDPYYLKSEMINIQRAAHRKDMLTPRDPGFRMYYGHEDKALHEQMDKEERENFQPKIIV